MNPQPIGIILGDPNGIGPELIAKLMTSHLDPNQPLVIFGDQHLFEMGAKQAGVSADFLSASHVEYRPMDTITPSDVSLAEVTEVAGR